MRCNAPTIARTDILQAIQDGRQLSDKQTYYLALKLRAVHGVLRQVTPVKNDWD